MRAVSGNVQNLLYESDRANQRRMVSRAGRSRGAGKRYPVKITVYCDDRTGMLKELTAVISDENTIFAAWNCGRDEEGEAIIEFIVEAEDVRHLNRMVLGLRRVAGVRHVERAQERCESSYQLLAISLFREDSLLRQQVLRTAPLRVPQTPALCICDPLA